ncbi:hypothetical protein GQ457_06G021610 [Hibiscus cannabinus]
MQTQINQNRCRLGLSSVLLISPSVGNTRSITEFGNSYGKYGQQHLLVMLDLPPVHPIPHAYVTVQPSNHKFERLTQWTSDARVGNVPSKSELQ